MRKVIIESPFAANEKHTEVEHREYLNRCIHDSVLRDESPYASHKMLVDSLDDSIPEERTLGIEAGFAWKHLDGVNTVFYLDYGWSGGMQKAWTYCKNNNLPFEYREIGKN